MRVFIVILQRADRPSRNQKWRAWRYGEITRTVKLPVTGPKGSRIR